MKNIFKILTVALVAFLIVSCDKDEDLAVAATPSDNPTLSVDKSSVVLTKEDAANTALTFKWQNPNYGVALGVKNVLQVAKKGTNFEAPVSVDIEDGTTEKSFTVQEFNALMLNLGLDINVSSDIEARVKSSVNGAMEVLTQAVPLKVTPYALISYLYAPGAYQEWNPATAETLVSATSNGIYIGYIKFTAPDSEFKITTERNWDNSYGTTDNKNLVYNGGGNLKAANAGYQKLTVNTNTLTFALEAYSWGVIGDATPGGWDVDTDLSWNSANQTWEIANIALVGGKELKFRLNNAWSVNYGGSNGSLVDGGDNIKVAESGNYKIVFDLINLKYAITKL